MKVSPTNTINLPKFESSPPRDIKPIQIQNSPTMSEDLSDLSTGRNLFPKSKVSANAWRRGRKPD